MLMLLLLLLLVLVAITCLKLLLQSGDCLLKLVTLAFQLFSIVAS
jgi:hypothetical protein